MLLVDAGREISHIDYLLVGWKECRKDIVFPVVPSHAQGDEWEVSLQNEMLHESELEGEIIGCEDIVWMVWQ